MNMANSDISLRIAFVAPRYWPSVGGAQFYIRELVHRLKHDHAVIVLTQNAESADAACACASAPYRNHYVDEDVPVYSVGAGGLWHTVLLNMAKMYGRFRPINPIYALVLRIAILPEMVRILAQFQADIVHTVHMGLVYSSEIAQKAAVQIQAPFVWTPVPHIEGGGWSGPRFRRLYRTADALTALTHVERAWLETMGARPGTVEVIPGGPSISSSIESTAADAFRARYGLGEYPVVLFLGQKLGYKGYRQVVEAAPLVWAQAPQTRFVFIGPRTAESTQFFASVNHPQILELPAVDFAEKNAALAACTLFCMPSVQESLGLVFLEAWHYCKPVIAADIGITHELVSDGIDGLIVKQTSDAIAAAIIRLVQSPQLCVELGTAGYRKQMADYTWERSVEELSGLYQRLISAKRKTRLSTPYKA